MHSHLRQCWTKGHFANFSLFIFNWMWPWFICGTGTKIKSQTSREIFKPILRECDLFIYMSNTLALVCLFPAGCCLVCPYGANGIFGRKEQSSLRRQHNLLVENKSVISIKINGRICHTFSPHTLSSWKCSHFSCYLKINMRMKIAPRPLNLQIRMENGFNRLSSPESNEWTNGKTEMNRKKRMEEMADLIHKSDSGFV